MRFPEKFLGKPGLSKFVNGIYGIKEGKKDED